MYYYIDFEASEAEKKIISVGCICEDGREFYSLVNTDDPITFRITQITGITQEKLLSSSVTGTGTLISFMPTVSVQLDTRKL